MLDLTENALLIDTFPPTSPLNTAARILRLGLAINCFSTLESYLEDCFTAATVRLRDAHVSFGDLPDPLKEFLLVQAAAGLAKRGSKIDKTRRISWYVENLPILAGYNRAPPSYTAFGFSPRGSNVSQEDIPAAFKSFGVGNAWARLSDITSNIGSSSIDLSSEFRRLAKSRHASAHISSSNIPTSDLQSLMMSAIYIGISTDILISAAVDCINRANKKSDIAGQLLSIDLKSRFLDRELNGTFVERNSASGPAIKRYSDRVSAITGAGGRAAKRFVIMRDVAGRPVELIDAQGLDGAR